VVVEIEGVVSVVTPVPFVTFVLPDAVVYQSIVHPEGGVALIFTVPALHREPFELLVGADNATTKPGHPVASVMVLIQPELNVLLEVTVEFPLSYVILNGGEPFN
jgi:hypothetical protein